MSEAGSERDSEGYSKDHGDEKETDITNSQDSSSPDRPAGEDSVAGMGSDRVSLRQRVEAILVVVDAPISPEELARILDASVAEIAKLLASLRAQYLADRRGFELRDVAGGWRLYSAPECASDVERFVLDGAQARLTHAALETLAVVAYGQPVSRQSIAAIRGVSVDGVVRTLLARGLITESGVGAGGAGLYVTTPFFLSRLGLKSVDELPSLAPYLPEDLGEFEDAF